MMRDDARCLFFRCDDACMGPTIDPQSAMTMINFEVLIYEYIPSVIRVRHDVGG